MVKQPTVRVVLYVALHHHWSIQQLDVYNVFLQDTSRKMFTIDNYRVLLITLVPLMCPKSRNFYLALNKPLGLGMECSRHLLLLLKDSKTVWLIRLFLQQGRVRCSFHLIACGWYSLTGSSTSSISGLIAAIRATFVMKDWDPLHCFLGIEVVQNSSAVFLSQTKYFSGLLVKDATVDCKPCVSSLKTLVLEDYPLCLTIQNYRRIVVS